MTDTTPRLGLPLLQSGQAQKELFHNEALTTIDAALNPVAETLGETVPPAEPAVGAAWIVGAGATGAWAGQAQRLACWTTGGWRFATPAEGALVWVRAQGVHARRSGGGWISGEMPVHRIRIGGIQVVGPQGAQITTPAGGTTVDNEARTAVSSILNILRNHGLIAS